MHYLETLGNYIHRELPDLSDPFVAERWHDRLTSGRRIPREFISALTQQRDPDTASIVYQNFDEALMNLNVHPNDPGARDEFYRALGFVFAFNYINGMHVLKKVHGPLELIEHGIERRVKLSSATSYQLIQEAQIQKDDKVLELFCGVGYGTFFLALTQPQVLISVDKFTPEYYDLEGTFYKSRNWLFKDVDQLRKYMDRLLTPPTFVQGDATNLPDELHGINFTKGIMHPPYGRESLHIPTMDDLSELDAFALWVKSLNHVSQIQNQSFAVYSVVPSEWVDAISLWQNKRSTIHAIASHLTTKLKTNPYYLAQSQKDVPDQFTDRLERLKGVQVVRNVDVLDTKKFPLKIVVTDHRQAA